MPVERDEAEGRHPPVRGYPAEKARQGRVFLNTRARRIVFVSGLVGMIALVIALWVLSGIDGS